LPPADDVAVNGGFESGDLDGWVSAGATSPTVTTTYAHSGDSAAFLGQQSEYTEPVTLTENAEHYNGGYQMAVDSDSVVHLVWVEFVPETATDEIYYRFREPNGDWSNPINGSNSPLASKSPELLVAEDNTVHVIWTESGLFHSAKNPEDGTWTSPVNVTNESNAEWALSPDGTLYCIEETDGDLYLSSRSSGGVWHGPEWLFPGMVHNLVVDSNGMLHLIFSESAFYGGSLLHAMRTFDGGWSEPRLISQLKTSFSLAGLVADTRGGIHVLLYQSAGSSGYYYACSWDNRQGWSETVLLTTRSYDWIRLAGFSTDQHNTIHVAWQYPDGIHYAWRDNVGIWSSFQQVMSDANSDDPHMVVDPSGIVRIFWQLYTYTESGHVLRQANQTGDGTWTDPRTLLTRIPDPTTVAVGGNGNIHVVWSQWDRIYYTSLAAAEGSDSSLAQTLAVPAVINPTLSFLVQLGGLWADSSSWFGVGLDNGISQSALFTTTTSTNWTHHWIDLTPWAGDVVTLTFSLHQEDGGTAAWAFLDDVTVGSAYPDIWLEMKGRPPGALPGEQLIYTASYGNRGGTEAEGVTIGVTVPSELQFVDSNPLPIATKPAVVWDVGALPGKSEPYSVVLTTSVAPTAATMVYLTSTVTIDTTSQELETMNNLAQVSNLVGRLTYLPLVVR
jgi:uncharacterized repeat protein (TIGR01451 family)